MSLSKLKSVFAFFVAVCGACIGADAAFLSDYGQIQNVPDYSLNPANKIGTPYNQKFPQVIYAQGTDLDTAECERTVAALIAAYCVGINNCVEMRLSDVRPVIMVQLSRLPGHNYASACGGFIDSEFDRFISQYGNAAPQYRVTFPNATEPVTNSGGEFQIKNPYEIKLNDWQIDYLERANELEQLQAINGAGTESLARADFPETFADLPFEERMAILQSGYEQYKDSTAYKRMNIENNKGYLTRVGKTNNDLTKKKEHDSGEMSAVVGIAGGMPIDDELGNRPAGDNVQMIPWYGILVVKSGSLDELVNPEMTLISAEFMSKHKDRFYPANSDSKLKLKKGCTSNNKMAHDKDVVNRAAHVAMGEKDSFWSGNDYYVWDGSSELSKFTLKQMSGVGLNGFGLLLADKDLNSTFFITEDVPNPEDARTEAINFANRFYNAMTKVNAEDSLCDVDIYVAQIAVNPDSKTQWYSIVNPGASLRVSSGTGDGGR